MREPGRRDVCNSEIAMQTLRIGILIHIECPTKKYLTTHSLKYSIMQLMYGFYQYYATPNVLYT